MKPPFVYYGGKTVAAPRIAGLLPPHQHYVEPYAGSLAVLLARTPTPMETVNDLDQDLMTFWRTLRDHPEDLIRVCSATPHSVVELRNAYQSCDDDLERARRVWVRLTQGRSGRLASTGWRQVVKPTVGMSMPSYLAAYVDRMGPVVDRLAKVSLECRPALEVIEKYGSHEDVLLYVDPPYLASTRGNKGYACEMASESEHRELAEVLRGCRASVVLSGYASDLYHDLYNGWERVEMAARSVTHAERTEVLWSNRALSEVAA